MNSEYAVLLSIHPRHCAKIAANEKTFELRKQIPRTQFVKGILEKM